MNEPLQEEPKQEKNSTISQLRLTAISGSVNQLLDKDPNNDIQAILSILMLIKRHGLKALLGFFLALAGAAYAPINAVMSLPARVEPLEKRLDAIEKKLDTIINQEPTTKKVNNEVKD